MPSASTRATYARGALWKVVKTPPATTRPSGRAATALTQLLAPAPAVEKNRSTSVPAVGSVTTSATGLLVTLPAVFATTTV